MHPRGGDGDAASGEVTCAMDARVAYLAGSHGILTVHIPSRNMSPTFSATRPFQRTTITDGVWLESFLHRFTVTVTSPESQPPADIRNTATYSTSKRHLKSFLFRVADGL